MNLRLLCMTILAVAIPQLSLSAEDHHGPKKHIVGVFLGLTSGNGHSDKTIGLEYEYRFDEMFGVGVVVEHIPDAHGGDGASLYMGQVHLHPYKDLRLSGGYGREKVHHEGTHAEDVLRLGVAYDFHFDGFGIAPTFNLDWIDGHTSKVFGIVVNKGF